MAGFDYVPLNQGNKKNDQEQAQAVNQMLQMGHLMIYKEKQDEIEADRQFKAWGAILTHPDFPDEMKIEAANNMAQKVGVQGTVTLEGLRPFAGAMKSILADHAKYGDKMDWSQHGPMLEMIGQNPKWIMPSQLPELAKLSDEYGTFRATRAVNLANPEGNAIAEARGRIRDRAQDLTELRQNKDKYLATVNGEPFGGTGVPNPDDKASAQMKLDRLRQMEADDGTDTSIVEEGRHVDALNTRIVQFVKNRPDAIKAIEDFGLKAAGILPVDDNYVKARWHQLQQIPMNRRTEEDNRQLDLMTTYITGKSGASMRAAASAQVITGQQQEIKAHSQIIGDVQAADQQGQQDAEQQRTMMSALTEKAKLGTLTEEQYKDLAQETAGYSAVLGSVQQAALQANKPKVDAILQQRQQLEEDLNDAKKRLPTTPFAQRDDLRGQIQLKKDLLQSAEARAALLSTHGPLASLDYEWQAQMARQDAEHIKVALGKEGLTPEEKTKLEDDYAAADQKATVAERKLKEWTGERNNYLATLTRTQTTLDEQSRVLDQKKTSVQRAIEKDEATAGLYQAAVTDMGHDESLSLDRAIAQNMKHWPGANIESVRKNVEGFFKDNYEKANGYAQLVFSGYVANEKQEPTPQRLMALANKAAVVTREQTKQLVKVDDIMKAYDKGSKSTLELKLPSGSVKDAVEVKQAWEAARPLLDFMDKTIRENPSAVGISGSAKQLLAGASQQWAALWADAQANGKIDSSALKYFSSQPTDELEAAAQILTYHVARAMSPVGVISDQDAQNAQRVVGDIKSWRAGHEQLLNKIQFVKGWFYARAQGADQMLADPQGYMHTPSTPPGGKEGTAAPGRPKTAEEYLQGVGKALGGQ